MTKVTGPSNVHKRMLARKLWQTKCRIWCDVSKRLVSAQKNRVEVNLAKLNAATKKGDVVVIPGKVLANGILDEAITVACYAISKSAVIKLNEAGCNQISIEELLEQNPTGKGVKIII